MKKNIIYIMAAFLSFSFLPGTANASTNTLQTVLTGDSLSPVQADRSTLSTGEMHAQNSETVVRGRTADGGNGGIYISVGALIIIILLLIILL